MFLLSHSFPLTKLFIYSYQRDYIERSRDQIETLSFQSKRGRIPSSSLAKSSRTTLGDAVMVNRGSELGEDVSWTLETKRERDYNDLQRGQLAKVNRRTIDL